MKSNKSINRRARNTKRSNAKNSLKRLTKSQKVYRGGSNDNPNMHDYDYDYYTQITNLTNDKDALNKKIKYIQNDMQLISTNIDYNTATEDVKTQYNKYIIDKQELEKKINLINYKIYLFTQAQQLQENITTFFYNKSKPYSSEDIENYSNMQTQLKTINGEIAR